MPEFDYNLSELATFLEWISVHLRGLLLRPFCSFGPIPICKLVIQSGQWLSSLSYMFPLSSLDLSGKIASAYASIQDSFGFSSFYLSHIGVGYGPLRMWVPNISDSYKTCYYSSYLLAYITVVTTLRPWLLVVSLVHGRQDRTRWSKGTLASLSSHLAREWECWESFCACDPCYLLCCGCKGLLRLWSILPFQSCQLSDASCIYHLFRGARCHKGQIQDW